MRPERCFSNTALPEDLISVPSTHVSQFTTACKSSSNLTHSSDLHRKHTPTQHLDLYLKGLGRMLASIESCL